MLWFLACYFGVGFLCVLKEHQLMSQDNDFELTLTEKVLGALQLIFHYSRLFLVWPLYLAEDALVFFYNRGRTDE